jgi:putative DNA primase/helicase
MERLASLDWQRAAKLWDKYRPDDIDKPIFIDGDDVDEKKPDRGTPLPQDEVSQDNIPDTKRRDIHENESLILESLRKRFLQAENKFYFRDTENKLAFEDHGKRLATEHNDPEIIRSMVDLAEAKGWTSINLKGADEFKREVWLQASLKGMEVTGFKPQSVDLARLNDLRSEINIPRKPLNTIDQAVEREAVVDEQKQTLSKQQRTAIEALQTILRSRGDSEKVVEMASTTAAERFLTNRVHVGNIIDHGTAPYDNNTDNEQSYFVQIQNKDMSEKTVWGVDLKRAVEESNAAIGSDVVLAYQGRQQVTVKVKERDEQGNMTGTKDIIANRNTWDVKQIETMREEAIRHFTAIASNTRQPQVMVYDNTAPRAQVRPEISREMFREPELSR